MAGVRKPVASGRLFLCLDNNGPCQRGINRIGTFSTWGNGRGGADSEWRCDMLLAQSSISPRRNARHQMAKITRLPRAEMLLFRFCDASGLGGTMSSHHAIAPCYGMAFPQNRSPQIPAQRNVCPCQPKADALHPASPTDGWRGLVRISGIAGWSSPVARQAHNLKVVSSNLAPATTENLVNQ